MRSTRWWALVAVASLGFAAAAGAQSTSNAQLERYGECQRGVMGEEEAAEDPLRACQAAAAIGIPGAQYALAVHLLEQDDAGPEVEAIALEWLRKAESSGHPPARFALAMFHSSGRAGVRQDRDEALRLLREAYCEGYPEAVELVDRMEIELERCRPGGRGDELSGWWRGSLAPVYGTSGGEGGEAVDLLVELGVDQPRVFTVGGGEWTEIKPGAFMLREESGTAIVQALDSSWELAGWSRG